MHPSEYLGSTDVAPDASTFTIEIEARSRDKIVAEIMALTLADYFADERTAYYAQQDKRDRIEVKVVSRAIEAAQYQPQPLVNALAGGVLGFLLGVGLILLLIWVESGFLRTPESVERTLGLTVLGAIPVTAFRINYWERNSKGRSNARSQWVEVWAPAARHAPAL